MYIPREGDFSMRLKKLEIIGFKSFAKKGVMEFSAPISAVVGPNGSGKSNVAESIRFVLGEQSLKSMRGKKGEDLIFNGSEKTGRLNHAKVTITFDNTDRGMKIDFDEVSISREVYRDGTHQYYINGSQVRLKDVIELLASVHIGASGHHIISQGEADRILNASVKERKIMIEDALGLKVYHWKIDESEKKLCKTETNIKEVELLRREIAPQLRYLKKQVEKIEKAAELREQLGTLLAEYLKREEVYISATRTELTQNKAALLKGKSTLDEQIAQYEELVARTPENSELAKALSAAEETLRTVRVQRADVNREIGRVEGVIEYEKDKQKEKPEVSHDEPPVAFSKVKTMVDSVKWTIGEALGADDVAHIKVFLKTAEEKLVTFIDGVTHEDPVEQQADNATDDMLADLKKKRDTLRTDLEEITQKENAELASIENIKKKQIEENSAQREAERQLYQARAQRTQVTTKIATLDTDLSRLQHVQDRFEEEVRAAVSVVGQKAQEYHGYTVDAAAVLEEARAKQEDRRMKIERIKIRIEDMGGASGEDVLKEYEELKERDSFLDKELGDLKNSAGSLRALIGDLSLKLENEFMEGIEKINVEFQKFFALMFGGGSAALTVAAQPKRKRRKTDDTEDIEMDTSDEENTEKGIDIDVILPRKKVKGLTMLSGGERALTSIALLFAMSQVKPPPFLILDETDAALDEANSRKYGDMLENLSKYSQLIVVTHNRETMGRAGILYGVTMGNDATSKLLSIKFEEAVEVAK
jgi:chromosome segregation protein